MVTVPPPTSSSAASSTADSALQAGASALGPIPRWGRRRAARRPGWPGTKNANLDILLVGPGGVLVADVKRWRDVHVTADGLYRGGPRPWSSRTSSSPTATGSRAHGGPPSPR